MKNKRKISKQMKSRQKQFVNHWSVSQSKTNYDALADKHASYYFGTTGVMKHLKKLKKVINKEPHNKQVDNMVSLLDNKIGAKKDRQNSLQKSRQKVQAYTKQLKAGSLEKLSKTKYNLFFQKNKDKQKQKNKERQIETETGHQKRQLDKLKFPQITNSKPQVQTGKQLTNLTVNLKQHKRGLNSTHNRVVKHEQFMDFLNKRKQKLVKENTQHQKPKTSQKIQSTHQIKLAL